jgi:hypothetical protein
MLYIISFRGFSIAAPAIDSKHKGAPKRSNQCGDVS